MPPRQPLKLRQNASRRTTKRALQAAAARDAAPAAPQPAPAKTPRPPAFSPYPDLTMAIQMLANRAATMAEGERRQLIAKWQESLTKINDEMQKLHKLEILATRLISPTGKE